MTTIFPHLTVASVLAVHHLGNARISATGSSATQSIGSAGVALLLLLIVFFAMMARAARGMADLVAGFLRIAASMTSSLVIVVIVVIVVVLFLLH
jgi:hypothetical protein